MREAPFAALDFIFFRYGDFDQMADGGGQDKIVRLIIVGDLFEAAQRA